MLAPVLLAALWALSISSFLPAWHFLLEIIINSTHYLAVGNLAVVAIAIVCKQKLFNKILIVLISFIICALQLLPLKTLLIAHPLKLNKISSTLKIFYANVELELGQKEELVRLLVEQNPDLVGLVEVDQEWIKFIESRINFPYKIAKPQNDNFGMVLYANYPIQEKANSDFGSDLTPHINAELSLGETTNAQVILLHALPPVSNSAIRHNRLLFRRIATHAKNYSNNLVVLGDFNGMHFSDNYQKLTNWANLKSAADGTGFISTWHARNPLIFYIIDHILYQGCISVQDFQRLAAFNSDHFPLVSQLTFGELPECL